MYRIILILFALSLGSASRVENNADDICTRSDGKSGYCLHMSNCSKIFNIFVQNKMGTPYTPDDLNYIRNSKCPVHKKGYVCCESEDKVSQGIQELSSQDCGKFGHIKMIGGTEIGLMSRPWMALLKLKSSVGEEEFGCGGSLISKRYILTAAHCFNNHELVSVRLGEHNITSDRDCTFRRGREVCAPPVEDFDYDRVYIHEQYSMVTGHNDIALVKLKTDVVFKESIRPICLPITETLQQNVDNMQLFYITGWGKTETTFLSNVPLESAVTKKDRKICSESFRREIISSQICAGDRGRDSCNGDSGGPLKYFDLFNGQQRFVQFGIVSYGSRNCGDVNPAVYTNVGSYIPWIAYKIATK